MLFEVNKFDIQRLLELKTLLNDISKGEDLTKHDRSFLNLACSSLNCDPWLLVAFLILLNTKFSFY